MLTVTRPYPFPFAPCSVLTPAPYVSVILKFPLKGKYSVSTQDSKKFGCRAWISSLIHNFVCWCWNLILFCHLLKMKCVFFRIVMFVLVVGGVACALNKSLAAFGGRGPKDHVLGTNPKMRHVNILLAAFLFIAATHCFCFF